MNGLKARLISIKNRICRHLCKKRTNSRRRIGLFGRRISSSLKKLFTIHRLRLKIRRRRSQVSRCDREKKTGSTPQASCEGERLEDTGLSEVAPTQLRDQNCETSSLSGNDTPFTVPTLTLLPPCTPTSTCLSATPRSPSLTSWDSWSSFESTDEEDNSVSSTDSELSPSDSLFTISDDDDNEEMEEGDKSECLSSTSTVNEQLQAEFGTETVGNCIHVFPIVSSGIVADGSVTQSDDNDFESDEFVTVSQSSSEELRIEDEQHEDTTNEDNVYTELLNAIPAMPAFLPPQVTVSEIPCDSQSFHCISTEGTDLSLESGNCVAVSRTSSEEELRTIFGIESEDTDESFTELQNTVPGTQSFIPPQAAVHSQCSNTLQPAETSIIHCTKPTPVHSTKPAPLTLSLPGDDPTTPPPGPSTVEAEKMWKEYARNHSTAPEYFLYPPFTPEQEEWIVAMNHPFKEYVLQTWQSSIHSSVQGWLEDLVN